MVRMSAVLALKKSLSSCWLLVDPFTKQEIKSSVRFILFYFSHIDMKVKCFWYRLFHYWYKKEECNQRYKSGIIYEAIN
jgi:hypothetical protein